MSEPSEEEYREFVAKVEALPPSLRAWVVPIFSALDELGGVGTPNQVESKIREHTRDRVSKGQWSYALRKKSVRFARNALRIHGGISGEKRGVWKSTNLGRRFWHERKDLELVPFAELPSLDLENAGAVDGPLETVDVTSLRGYDVPVLRVLSSGSCKRAEVFSRLSGLEMFSMLPGDRRFTRHQIPVFRQNAGWTLSRLKSDGLVRNPAHGVWEITKAGREFLAREEPSWNAAAFRGSKAKVLPLIEVHGEDPRPEIEDLPDLESEDEDSERPAWERTRWDECRADVSAAAYATAHRRLRPELGPTPDTLRVPIPRSLILYGPPGTGKTYTASKIAAALTGEQEPSDDGLFRILQFHPSYSYEDFVQGLRPDLTRSGIHYRVEPGPLRRICDEAVEDPDRFYVLVIDEINRGDPARIFGEALLALEYRGQAVSMPIGASLVIPPNLVVLGTMNSVDRSIALMDYALRRRFGFVYLAPDLEVVRKQHRGSKSAQRSIEAVAKLNQWLEGRLGREHVIGHSFLLNPAYPVDERRSLDVLWEADIRPLLDEYLFHDRGGFSEVCDLWAEWTARPAKVPDDAG